MFSKSVQGQVHAYSEDTGDAKIADYQELTDQEESDLIEIVEDCEGALRDAENFVDKLSTNLSQLDGDNMTTIMKSDTAIRDLMSTLQSAIDDVTRVESELERYDSMLGSIQSQMGTMKSQQSFIQISDVNQKKLVSELESIVEKLEMPPGHMKALREANLDSASGITNAINAAEHLSQAMKIELPTGFGFFRTLSHFFFRIYFSKIP